MSVRGRIRIEKRKFKESGTLSAPKMNNSLSKVAKDLAKAIANRVRTRIVTVRLLLSHIASPLPSPIFIASFHLKQMPQRTQPVEGLFPHHINVDDDGLVTVGGVLPGHSQTRVRAPANAHL